MKGRSLSRNLTHLSTLALDKKNWEQPPFSLLYTLFYSEAKVVSAALWLLSTCFFCGPAYHYGYNYCNYRDHNCIENHRQYSALISKDYPKYFLYGCVPC